MFDVSFSELALTALVGFVVFGKSEFKDLVSAVFNIKSYFDDIVVRFKALINEQLNEEDVVDIIYDEEGNPHKAYNVERLKPYFKDEAKDE